MSQLRLSAQKIIELVREIQIYKNYKFKLIKDLKELDKRKANKEEYDKILKGKTKKEQIDYYNSYILELLEQIEKLNENIRIYLKSGPQETKQLQAPVPLPISKEVKVHFDKPTITKREKSNYMDELNLDLDQIKRAISPRSKKEKINVPSDIGYTVYKSTAYGKIANDFFESLTLSLTRGHSNFFKRLYDSLISSDTKILSKTYVSMMFFSSFLAFIFVSIGTFLAYYLLDKFTILLAIIRSLIFGFLAAFLIFFIIYLYPTFIVNSRRRKIKNDLPFVIIHMAAIAGSGAQPISIFESTLSSEEYIGLHPEIKKIVNYVNLFGYDLSNALRAVANTTPSPEFRELLNGIISTIESGGNLKEYLKAKATDSMSTYSMERKKYVKSLSTYSDIYIAVLIAAPLLFFTTLAIINMPMLGGKIFGMTANTLAMLGTFGVIPLLNILFLLFLNIIQPKT